MSIIADNLREVENIIALAAKKSGRNFETIKLVAVTKTVGTPRIIEALEAGISEIGENRIQEAKLKYGELSERKIIRHMIGHLQTNKVKDAVKIFDYIHSVDSMRLALEIDKEAKKINKIMPCLIEINSGNEISKYGIKFEEAAAFVRAVAPLANLRFEGLMTVAPISSNPEDLRPIFRKMKELLDHLIEENKDLYPNFNFKHLSMGMSQDYMIAIEEGSTMVRVGSAIFGKRS